MASPPQQPDFLEALLQELRQLWKEAGNWWGAGMVDLRNWFRRLRRARADYIVLEIDGSLPERDPPPRSFIQRQLPLPSPPLTMQQVHGRLRAIADADNVKGVVLKLGSLQVALARLQSLRRAIERLQEAGKEVVVYAIHLDLPHYYVASAADRIIAPPSANFDFLGLYSSVTFMKEALGSIGIEVDVIQISPYKSAFDNLGRSDISPEMREQIDWQLDDTFDQLTADMARGRGMGQTEFRALVDAGPYIENELVSKGLVDALAYEDELPYLLAQPKETSAETEPNSQNNSETQPQNNSKRPTASLVSWSEGSGLLTEKFKPRSRQWIGVISLEGLIMTGESRSSPVPLPLFGGETAGSDSLAQAFRLAEQLPELAALVFYVNSSGGDALASDLINREVERLNTRIPVLVYMGDVAASGGYHVSSPSRHIMSQPGTITGSIGVITARANSSGLLEKLKVNEVSFQRGERAGLYRRNANMSDEERRVYREMVEGSYRQFKERVAAGRDIPYDELDPVAQGKVWLGRQALGHRLVDSHGDFVDALQKAAKLAGMPVDTHRIPVGNLYPKDESARLPQPFEPAAELVRLLSGERLRALLGGRPMFLMPFDIRFW